MLYILIQILKASVARNGEDKPLTVGHLLNILLMAQKVRHKQADDEDKQHHSLMNQINPFGQD